MTDRLTDEMKSDLHGIVRHMSEYTSNLVSAGVHPVTISTEFLRQAFNVLADAAGAPKAFIVMSGVLFGAYTRAMTPKGEIDD